MIEIFKIIGVLGILLISIGIIVKKRKDQDMYYIAGGIFLVAYSIYIEDLIFIILQIIFTSTATYNFIKVQNSKK